MEKWVYILLALCVAGLIYLRKGWEKVDLQNVSVENIVVLALLIVVISIGLIFLSPYLKKKKMAFQEGSLDKKKIYGGKDIT